MLIGWVWVGYTTETVFTKATHPLVPILGLCNHQQAMAEMRAAGQMQHLVLYSGCVLTTADLPIHLK